MNITLGIVFYIWFCRIQTRDSTSSFQFLLLRRSLGVLSINWTRLRLEGSNALNISSLQYPPPTIQLYCQCPLSHRVLHLGFYGLYCLIYSHDKSYLYMSNQLLMNTHIISIIFHTMSYNTFVQIYRQSPMFLPKL